MLEAKGVTIRFGGLVAVNKVDLTIKENLITGLIGPNGAGKTTFFNAISGVCKPDEGSINFNGKFIQGMKPYQICDAGMSRTYQVINLFTKMSVIENVMVGMHPHLKSNFWQSLFHSRSERKEEKKAYDEAHEWLKFVKLEDRANDPAGSLPYGGQRLLEIVRALASRPKILLLDEPAAGMNPVEKNELDSLLKQIILMGVDILLIEHDMKLVMGVCDYVYVLNRGILLAQGKPEEVQANPEVVEAYLGGE